MRYRSYEKFEMTGKMNIIKSKHKLKTELECNKLSLWNKVGCFYLSELIVIPEFSLERKKDPRDFN